MGIMDKLFGNNQQPAPAQPAPANTPAGLPAGYTAATPATATSDANGMIPPDAASAGAGTDANASPLDEYNDLWQNPDNKDAPPIEGVLGNLDPKQFMEAAGKVNFARVVTPEELAAINAGGEAATKAFGSAMNKVSQAVYAQSALASSKLIEQATDKLEERILAKLPDQVRRNILDNSMVEDNKAYSHPAAAPLVQLVQNQLASKHPNATPSELKKMAQTYFDRTFKSISGDGKPAQTTTDKNNADIDWGVELDLF